MYQKSDSYAAEAVALALINMLDYNPERNDYDNWIPFILRLYLPNRNSMIEENVKATMTVFEIKNLLYGIENVLLHLENKEN